MSASHQLVDLDSRHLAEGLTEIKGGSCASIQAVVGFTSSHMTKQRASILSRMKSGLTKSRSKVVDGMWKSAAMDWSFVWRYIRASPRIPPGAVTSRLGILFSITNCSSNRDLTIASILRQWRVRLNSYCDCKDTR